MAKSYQHLPLQDLPKFTQIRIFGLKINHLATLVCALIFLQQVESAIKFSFFQDEKEKKNFARIIVLDSLKQNFVRNLF
jgi:hypothetical protein